MQDPPSEVEKRLLRRPSETLKTWCRFSVHAAQFESCFEAVLSFQSGWAAGLVGNIQLPGVSNQFRSDLGYLELWLHFLHAPFQADPSESARRRGACLPQARCYWTRSDSATADQSPGTRTSAERVASVSAAMLPSCKSPNASLKCQLPTGPTAYLR